MPITRSNRNWVSLTASRLALAILPILAISLSWNPAPARAQCAPQWLEWPNALDNRIDGIHRQTGVNSLTVYNGQLIASGMFTTVGGVETIGIAAWDGSSTLYGWHALGVGIDSQANALTVYNGLLIAGGNFNNAGGVGANRIAAWDGNAWSPLGSGLNGQVFALTVYNGDLIAGGSFTTAGGTPANLIARWDGAAWHALGNGLGNGYGSPTILALTVYNGELIASGQAFTVNGVGTANSIARWDGNTWRTLGSGIGNGTGGWVPAPTLSLTTYNGLLIAGGFFTTAGNVLASDIASWDGTTWRALGGGIGAGFGPGALTVFNGQLIAGGSFATAGGVTANYMAAWDGNGWQPMGTGMDNEVLALTVFNNQLIAGGQFATAGGQASGGVARWGDPCAELLVAAPQNNNNAAPAAPPVCGAGFAEAAMLSLAGLTLISLRGSRRGPQ